jgi:hypothetical protein
MPKIFQSAKGEPPRPCDQCDKPGLWNLRARQMFLCEEHRRKLEWEQGDETQNRN